MHYIYLHLNFFLIDFTQKCFRSPDCIKIYKKMSQKEKKTLKQYSATRNIPKKLNNLPNITEFSYPSFPHHQNREIEELTVRCKRLEQQSTHLVSSQVSSPPRRGRHEAVSASPGVSPGKARNSFKSQ